MTLKELLHLIPPTSSILVRKNSPDIYPATVYAGPLKSMTFDIYHPLFPKEVIEVQPIIMALDTGKKACLVIDIAE